MLGRRKRSRSSSVMGPHYRSKKQLLANSWHAVTHEDFAISNNQCTGFSDACPMGPAAGARRVSDQSLGKGTLLRLSFSVRRSLALGGCGQGRTFPWSPHFEQNSVVPRADLRVLCYFASLYYDPTRSQAPGNFIIHQIKPIITLFLSASFTGRLSGSRWALLFYGIAGDQSAQDTALVFLLEQVHIVFLQVSLWEGCSLPHKSVASLSPVATQGWIFTHGRDFQCRWGWGRGGREQTTLC